jgi:hypothetical protein
VAKAEQALQQHVQGARHLAILSTSIIHNVDQAVLVTEPAGMVHAPYLYAFSTSCTLRKEGHTVNLTLRELLLTLPYPLRNGGPTQEELAKSPRPVKKPNMSDRLFQAVDFVHSINSTGLHFTHLLY